MCCIAVGPAFGVDLLLAYTIGSGSLICLLNAVSLVLSFVYPHNIVFSASTLVGQAVYNNSFVVALNTRDFVRSRGELGDTALDTGGVVPGDERGPSGTNVDRVELPSIAFATGPSQSQLTEAGDESGTVSVHDGSEKIVVGLGAVADGAAKDQGAALDGAMV